MGKKTTNNTKNYLIGIMMKKCKICSRNLTKMNHKSGHELCYNCEANFPQKRKGRKKK